MFRHLKRGAYPVYLGVAQLGARYLGVVEVASSNLVTQIKKQQGFCPAVFLSG